MDNFVQDFLNSKEGLEWSKKEETLDRLKEIKSYIQDMTPISRNTISYMIKFFPEFTYRGVAYRFISQSKEFSTPLVWKDGDHNLSWSLHTNAHVSVLRSLTHKDHIIHIYEAQVEGLNLKDLINNLQETFSFLKETSSLADNEDEILVLKYENLSLHQIL